MEADYPEDPVGHTSSGFTPINKVKPDPSTSEEALDDLKDIKQEPETEESGAAPPTPTVTPKKRGKKTKDGADVQDNETPTKKSRATPSKANPIPTSFESAGMADRLILRMRDDEGKSWTEITAAWSSLTGSKVSDRTLSMRYSRMKANFTSISEDDEARLLKAKKEVEDKFESDKWHRIADVIVGDGGEKYPIVSLQKKYKELTKKSNGAAASEIKDEE